MNEMIWIYFDYFSIFGIYFLSISLFVMSDPITTHANLQVQARSIKWIPLAPNSWGYCIWRSSTTCKKEEYYMGEYGGWLMPSWGRASYLEGWRQSSKTLDFYFLKTCSWEANFLGNFITNMVILAIVSTFGIEQTLWNLTCFTILPRGIACYREK